MTRPPGPVTVPTGCVRRHATESGVRHTAARTLAKGHTAPSSTRSRGWPRPVCPDHQYLADAVTRSCPARGGHLWSHVWALTDAARLGRRLDDPRHIAWQDEALATAQRCGMRALTSQLLQVSGYHELAHGRRP